MNDGWCCGQHCYRAFISQGPIGAYTVRSLSQPLAITPITWMEIMYGAAGKAGQAKCKAILNEFDMEYLIRIDMDWAMQQLERHRLSHGVETNDCLIASVCHRLQVPLYTHNIRDMRVFLSEPLVRKPY